MSLTFSFKMAAIFRRPVSRGYRAQLQVKDGFDKHINPLHLTVSKRVAGLIQKDKNDDIFVCTLRVRRHEKWVSSADDNLDITSKDRSQTGSFCVSSAFCSAEDIAVCVWSEGETPETNSNDPTKEYLNDISGEIGLTLFCTEMFLERYNLSVCDDVYIRALRVYPITRAIFTVSDVEAYEWLQGEKFSCGLITEICKHPILVVQNDILLAPYPTTFIDDPSFQREWFHKIKAIACAPFMMGSMSVNTEIIVCYEEETERLSYDHGHLSTSNLDKYVSGGLFVSDFCRSLSADETDGVFHDIDKMTFNACVIQQERNWNIVLSSSDGIDLNTIIGIPEKLMRQHGLFDGSLIKISLVEKHAEIWSPSSSGDANSVRIPSKEKYVRVKCLSHRLGNTDMVFISSLLLFNLQSGPPINMAPVIRAEKSIHVVEANMDGECRPSSMSRSLVDNIQMATEMHVVIVNSPSYSPMCRYGEALKKHFQTPRLLNVGDIFAVRSSDDPEFWQDIKLDTGRRKPVMFFKVAYMFPRQPALYPCYVSCDNTNVSQIGSIHSHVPLGADRYLSLHNTTYGQGITCPGLDKYISGLEALVLPHIHRKIDGVHMLEMLPSILLSGSEGIGKTTIVETVARRLYIQVQQVNCHDLCGDTARSVEAKMKTTFLSAGIYAPCILLLKNIDVIGKEKDGTTEDPRVISTFYGNITELVTQMKQFPVVVVATTHSLSDLSEDMHQCFLHELNMEAPTEMERGEIIHGLLESETVSADVSVSHIAQRTAGFVLGDLIVLTQITKREAYSKALKICQTGSQRLSMEDEEDLALAGVIIEQSDFEQALNVMQSTHSDAIGAPKIPNVQWSDVGGLASIKRDILDTIQLPLQHPELLAAGLRRSGVLLYGPPGTGKTLLAKAVATECSLNFLSVKGPELINMYVGQSEANVREVFKRARSASPCVIFFDELDSLAPNRGRSGDSGGVMDRVVSQLLAELDGLHKSHDVFVIGATNRPDLLDPALLRPGRFDKLLYLGVPEDRESQLNILRAVTRKFKLEEGLELPKVVEKCPWNMTGADFYALCADAMLNTVKQKIKLLEKGEEVDQSHVAVAEEDFDLALQTLVPSVSPQELERYKEIRNKFTSV